MSNITPTQSRLVRNGIIKKTASAMAVVSDQHLSKNFKVPTPKKAVRFCTNRIYKMFDHQGLAISKILHDGLRIKENFGVVAHWNADKNGLIGRLIMVEGHPMPHAWGLPKIVVTRHVIERVSQRVNSINSCEIRDELGPAIASAIFSLGEKGNFYARTPRGIAMVILEESRFVIPTWIADIQARPEQIDGIWEKIPSGRGKSFETAYSSDIYQLRPQQNP
jgi:hypothetical protein